MKIFVGILLVLPAVVGAVSTAELCPDLSDACMNEENYAVCSDLVDSGCKDLMIMESCPLQFTCGDSEKPAAVSAYDACVSLYVYEDKKCSGEPLREMTFPTWSEPGSPCCT